MINYSRLCYCMKRELIGFSKKICKGLGKPEKKLVTNMLYGVSESQSCHLSKISRALKEKISLKKTIERLSRGLSDFSSVECLAENYINTIKRDIDDKTILIIDGSDIAKPYSKKLEDLCEVKDGSTGEITQGYFMLEMTALTEKHKMPIPVYSKIYSSKEEGFISEDAEVLNGLKCLTAQFGRKGIRALDRGYDALVYYSYFIKETEAFIIRCKKNRNIIYKEETRNILDVANQFKGKYRMDFLDKSGRKIECKLSIIPVALPMHPQKQLNLVVIYGFGENPMMLLTNLKSDDNRLCVTVAKVYLMRWRIEEYYRFKKQQFEFEDFRVRSLNAIRSLNLLVNALIGLIGTLSEKLDDSLFVAELIAASKRIYGIKKKNGRLKFIYYAIADGIFSVLNKSTTGISSFISQPLRQLSGQLSFLSVTVT